MFMKHVVPFEESLVDHGTVLVKLYFSVSKEKQAIRFEERRTDPLRQWKLSEIDLQAQSMWEQFTRTKYKMLQQTSHDKALWNIIRSSDKHKARKETMKLILNTIDYEGRSETLDFTPDAKIVFSAKEELALMDKHNSETKSKRSF